MTEHGVKHVTVLIYQLLIHNEYMEKKHIFWKCKNTVPVYSHVAFHMSQ